MVYSVRTDRPVISTKPLKTKRVEGEYSKKVREYMASHKIEVYSDDQGKVTVKEISVK